MEINHVVGCDIYTKLSVRNEYFEFSPFTPPYPAPTSLHPCTSASRLTAAPSEVGQVGFAKAGFSPADLERLKTDAAATLTDAFFERLLEAAGPEGGLLQAAVRGTRRLAALHTQ